MNYINYLAIIPARSGSKGIPNKNIKKICGKTLIEITVNCANKVDKIDGIFFTSDSQEYIDIYKSLNIKKDITGDYIRPINLASDTAPSNHYISDCLLYLEKKNITVKNFLILQVTSPLRLPYNIIEAIELYEKEKCKSVISIYEPTSHLSNCFYLKKDKYEKIIESNSTRRQDYDKIVALNGAIYIKNTEEYIKENTLKTQNTKFYLMNKINSIDIDDEEDFIIAECIYKNIL